jgi:hypothetical protein
MISWPYAAIRHFAPGRETFCSDVHGGEDAMTISSSSKRSSVPQQSRCDGECWTSRNALSSGLINARVITKRNDVQLYCHRTIGIEQDRGIVEGVASPPRFRGARLTSRPRTPRAALIVHRDAAVRTRSRGPVCPPSPAADRDPRDDALRVGNLGCVHQPPARNFVTKSRGVRVITTTLCPPPQAMLLICFPGFERSRASGP